MTSTRETGQVPIPVAINVMDVLRGVLRRKVMIAGIGLAALAGGLGMVNYLTPVYSTEALVLIQNLETPFDRVQALDNQRADAVDDRVVASQMSVLKSEDLGRRVVAALGLEQNPEFNSLLGGMGTVGKIKLALGFGEDPRLKSPEQRALGRYSSQLSVYQQPSSNVIAIKYSSHDPKTAAAVANMLAETYVIWTRESQSQPTERAREWLSGQIDALRQKLARSEQAVEAFRTEAGLLQGATMTLGTQEISELNTQITVARTASTEARARADAIRALLQNKGSVDASSDVLASAAVQRLKEQRTDATRRAAELSATYLPNHPRMIAAQSEIETLDRQIRSEALKVVSSLEEQARVADAREKSLRASLDQLKAQESSANMDDVRLKALERDAAADRALLEAMLSRYAEASSRQDQSAQPGLARIIQTAGVPASPSFPKAGSMVVLISVAGLSFAIGLAFLMELMSAAARLNQPSEAWQPQEPAMPDYGPLPVFTAVGAAPPPMPQPMWIPPAAPIIRHVASLPQVAAPAEGLAAIASSGVLAAGQQMANWVLAMAQTGRSRIGVTSIGGMAGDTSMAVTLLARGLASAGKRTIMIDAAPSGSWLDALCGIAPGPGIAELVGGHADFTKVISRDARSSAHLLRYGMDRSVPAAALIVERTESVLSALAQSYDAVIINLGEARAETPLLLHKCEMALVLAPVHRLNDATQAVQILQSSGMRAAGHVLVASPANQPAAAFELKSA